MRSFYFAISSSLTGSFILLAQLVHYLNVLVFRGMVSTKINTVSVSITQT